MIDPKIKADMMLASLIRIAYYRIVVLIIIIGLIPIGILIYSMADEYDTKLYRSNIFTCERTLNDRQAAIDALKIGLNSELGRPQLNKDIVAQYRAIINGLEKRKNIDCSQIYPKP